MIRVERLDELAFNQAVQHHLIRIFHLYLTLFSVQPGRHNRAVTLDKIFGGAMFKMAMFLGGFLLLTIMIGALATISPV
ncbi:hypothetical protein [Pseudomonas sp. IT-P176]|uniref:hypothetical protein n=1 Tax=Pseudomonas sp. IT-P176 TaxID=3026444 RepID=UPI0039DF3D98